MAELKHITCRFYDGAAGNVHQVRPGGPGYNHRGNDAWRHPRTQKDADTPVLNPWLARVDWAGTMAGAANSTWGNLVKAYMLEGPFKGNSYLIAHLNYVKVVAGTVVPAGTIIGYEGWTGHTIPAGAGGKHTHIELLAGTSFNYKDPSGLTGIPPVTNTDFINDYRPGAAQQEPDTSEIQVGETVSFKGGRYYTNSMGTSGYQGKAGPARVTAINPRAPMPYHIIHTTPDSTVYGWVTESSIDAIENIGEMRIGAVVRVEPGKKTYDGKDLASFVYATEYTVQQLVKDRAVIGINGAVTAAMNTADLHVVG